MTDQYAGWTGRIVRGTRPGGHRAHVYEVADLELIPGMIAGRMLYLSSPGDYRSDLVVLDEDDVTTLRPAQ